ncbi:MAG: magnesium/cobalt transporter CorA [Verrucomicrobiales bacterium]
MFKTRHPVPGSSPATLLPRPRADDTRPPRISLFRYDESSLEERVLTSVDEVPQPDSENKVTWINIDGLGDVNVLRTLGERFKLHPLTLEDLLDTGQRPKVEPYDDYLFIVLKMVYQNDRGQVCGEQVGFFLGSNFLITVQEEAKFDVFNPVRERLRGGRGAIRKSKGDYLAYALIDSIVDHYYPVLESMGTALEEVEDKLIDRPSRHGSLSLHRYKRILTQVRRFVWPLRDVVAALLHDETGKVTDSTKLFLRDCYDHTVQLMDLVETYRDVASGLMELYLSSVGLRTNEIMRVLTVITSIFIPLTFIVGIYGMNFAPDPPANQSLPYNMPELYHPYGYVSVLVVMVLIAVVQLVIFQRKKWL